MALGADNSSVLRMSYPAPEATSLASPVRLLMFVLLLIWFVVLWSRWSKRVCQLPASHESLSQLARVTGLWFIRGSHFYLRIKQNQEQREKNGICYDVNEAHLWTGRVSGFTWLLWWKSENEHFHFKLTILLGVELCNMYMLCACDFSRTRAHTFRCQTFQGNWKLILISHDTTVVTQCA